MAVVSAIAAATANAADKAALSPHRAIYDMHLLATRDSAEFTGMRGKMFLEWTDVCDGWTLNQRVRMDFTHREGHDIDNEFSFSSWESRDGSSFRYTMRTTTNGEVVEEIDGRAELDSGAGGGSARFTLPEIAEIALPPGTIFPTEHLFMTVATALADKPVLAKTMFSGTGLDSLNQVTAFIGSLIAPGSAPVAGSDAGSESDRGAIEALGALRSWPIDMAYFPMRGSDSEPEFEVHFRLMENGVSSEMDLDYGDFAIRATLAHLEILPPADC
ncbi:MAG: DUF1849 family protein [Alphaproteobacteria bacterium]|nr:DUF1849 family protein [Alphaproteobacteria bacterium]